jgi:hypothetical protein
MSDNNEPHRIENATHNTFPELPLIFGYLFFYLTQLAMQFRKF